VGNSQPLNAFFFNTPYGELNLTAETSLSGDEFFANSTSFFGGSKLGLASQLLTTRLIASTVLARPGQTPSFNASSGVFNTAPVSTVSAISGEVASLTGYTTTALNRSVVAGLDITTVSSRS
jgi:hypothetical protein